MKKRLQKEIDKSLKISVKEGSFGSVESGIGTSYLQPFAILLNATSSQIGILHAIVNFVPSISQILTSKAIEIYTRKSIVMVSVFLRGLLWLLVAAVGILFYNNVSWSVLVLILIAALIYSMWGASHVAWFSWMGSLVPKNRRGTYFSHRNQIVGLFGIISIVLGALVLDYFKKIGEANNNPLAYNLLGFGFLFFVVAIFKFASLPLLKAQYEPRIRINKKDEVSLFEFLRHGLHSPFGRFAIYRGIFSISVGIASAFWAVYMLRNLNFSYFWFMAVTVSSSVFQLIFLPAMGKISDKYGNVALMKLCSYAIFMVPVLWMASALIKNPLYTRVYLLLVPSLFSGIGWSGYNLATSNYVYDAVSQRKIGFSLSYLNLFVGSGTFIGAMIGSTIAYIGVNFMEPLLFIFLVSAITRALASIVGIRFLKEVRHVNKMSPHILIKEFQPVRGIVHELHSLKHFVSRVEHSL